MSSNSQSVPPPPPPANPAPPGITLPTVKPLTVGTSTPGQSAYQAGINSAVQQNGMLQALSGGKKKFLKGGNTPNSYYIPQLNMLYKPQNGPGQNPNDIIKSSVGTAGQTYANQVYDSCVGKTNCTGQSGGTRVCSSGEINCWGCYSGGKKKRRTDSRKRTTIIKRTTIRKRTIKRSKKRRTCKRRCNKKKNM